MYQSGLSLPASEGISAPAWASSPSDSPVTQPTEPLCGIAADTPVSTKDGPVSAKNLSPGMVLLTDANEAIVIDGIVETHLSFARLQQNRALAPIRFEPFSADPHHLHQAVLLAPDTPVHVDPKGEMTIRAAQLANWGTIRPVLPEDGITYLTLTVSRPATLEIAGVRLRLGATASADTIGQSAQTWRQEDKRVFRPIR